MSHHPYQTAACGAAHAYAFGPDPARAAVGSHGQPGLGRARPHGTPGAAPFVPFLMPHGGAPFSAAEFMGDGAFATTPPPCAANVPDAPHRAQLRARFREASVETIKELQRAVAQWPVVGLGADRGVVLGQTGLDFVRLLDSHLRDNAALQRLWSADAGSGGICRPNSALRTSPSHAIYTLGFGPCFGIDTLELQQTELSLHLLLARLDTLFHDVNHLRLREQTGAERGVPLSREHLRHLLERNGLLNEAAADHYSRHTARPE